MLLPPFHFYVLHLCSYHPRTGEQVVQLGETADKDEVTCVTVGPDGVVVATGNRQGRVKLW